MRQTPFIIFDGIDGCGKSTVLQFFKTELEQKGKKIFDLTGFSKQTARIPEFDELPKTDVIFSDEPTYVWIGAAIRGEIIKQGASYSAIETAHAFSLDRSVLYKRVIIPALNNGVTILQSRGLLTSLIYQPLQKGITPHEILALPGNALADEHPPDIFIHIDCPIKIALKRLGARAKDDNSFFEREAMLAKLQKAFYDPWFLGYLRRKEIERIILNTDESLEATREQIKKIINTYFAQYNFEIKNHKSKIWTLNL